MSLYSKRWATQLVCQEKCWERSGGVRMGSRWGRVVVREFEIKMQTIDLSLWNQNNNLSKKTIKTRHYLYFSMTFLLKKTTHIFWSHCHEMDVGWCNSQLFCPLPRPFVSLFGMFPLSQITNVTAPLLCGHRHPSNRIIIPGCEILLAVPLVFCGWLINGWHFTQSWKDEKLEEYGVRMHFSLKPSSAEHWQLLERPAGPSPPRWASRCPPSPSFFCCTLRCSVPFPEVPAFFLPLGFPSLTSDLMLYRSPTCSPRAMKFCFSNLAAPPPLPAPPPLGLGSQRALLENQVLSTVRG